MWQQVFEATTLRQPRPASSLKVAPRSFASLLLPSSEKKGPILVYSITKAPDHFSKRTCVTQQRTFFSMPSSKREHFEAFYSTKPRWYLLIATRVTSGKRQDSFQSDAPNVGARDSQRGPLPWVIIKSSPYFINFTRCAYVSKQKLCWALLDGSKKKIAFPPKNTTQLRFAIKILLSHSIENV